MWQEVAVVAATRAWQSGFVEAVVQSDSWLQLFLGIVTTRTPPAPGPAPSQPYPTLTHPPTHPTLSPNATPVSQVWRRQWRP